MAEILIIKQLNPFTCRDLIPPNSLGTSKPFHNTIEKSNRKKLDEMMFDISRLSVSACSYAVQTQETAIWLCLFCPTDRAGALRVCLSATTPIRSHTAARGDIAISIKVSNSISNDSLSVGVIRDCFLIIG
jgi:hypothetical protein